MVHAGLLLIILALGMGGTSLAHTLHLYQSIRLRYLKIHNWIFILFNYMVFMGLMLNYLQFNLGSQLSTDLTRKIFLIYHLQLSVVSVPLLFGFIFSAHELMRKRWARSWRICFSVVFGLLVISQAVCSILDLRAGAFPIHILFLVVIALSTQIIVAALAIRLILTTSEIPDPERQRSIKKFGYLILAISLSTTFLNTWQILGWMTLRMYVFLISFHMLIINLFPFLFMKNFVRKVFPEQFAATRTGQQLELLYQKYGISRREREIIQLICLGKSNQEIEDELFISLQTVKDHVHNIFRKTGVKNRVQLSNIFHISVE